MSAPVSMEPLLAREAQTMAALREAKAAHQQAHRQLGVALLQRLLAFRQMLEATESLDEDDFDELERLHDELHLFGWELEGEWLRATYGGYSRGGYEYDVRVPAWLMSDDWKERLAKESEQRLQRKAAREQHEAQEREVQEREQLSNLMRKYPNT